METLPGDQSQWATWASHSRQAGNRTSRGATCHGHTEWSWERDHAKEDTWGQVRPQESGREGLEGG